MQVIKPATSITIIGNSFKLFILPPFHETRKNRIIILR
jgi:hypothetical protein